MSVNDWCPNGVHDGSCNCIPEASVAAMAEWIRQEQVLLWDQLNDAVRNAINGYWSMQAENVVETLLSAARLVGAAPSELVPWRLLAGGVYDAVLTAGRVPHVLPDAAEWDRLDALMVDHGGTRAELVPQLANTVASVRKMEMSR